jgi:hypothetical protein
MFKFSDVRILIHGFWNLEVDIFVVFSSNDAFLIEKFTILKMYSISLGWERSGFFFRSFYARSIASEEIVIFWVWAAWTDWCNDVVIWGSWVEKCMKFLFLLSVSYIGSVDPVMWMFFFFFCNLLQFQWNSPITKCRAKDESDEQWCLECSHFSFFFDLYIF